jgi:hypothetical protein
MQLTTMHQTLSRLFRTRKGIARRPRVRLRLELLDERITPYGDNVWIGPENGLWSNPDNWSLDRIPTTGDVLHFGAGQFGVGTDTTSFNDIDNLSVHEIDTAGFTKTIWINNGISLAVEEDFVQWGTLEVHYDASIDVGNYLYINGTLETGGDELAPATIEAGNIVVECYGTWINEAGTVTNVTANQLYQGGLLWIQTESVLNLDGAYRLLPCGTLKLDGEFNIFSITPALINGTVIGSGRITSTGGIVINTGGVFHVTGEMVVGGDLINNEGTIRFYNTEPRLTFTITGNYTQYILGTLDIDWTNSLSVGGTASLNGTLKVRGEVELTGFPDDPEAYLIWASSGIGDFATKDIEPVPPAGWVWATQGGWYNGTAYVLDVVPAP